MELRPYQRAAIDCAWNWMRQHPGNPAIVIPTGGGKSPVMASMAREVAESGGRVAVLAHVRELVEQNHAKLRAVWPQAKAGIYSAGMRRRDRFEPILFCQIQSVAKRAAQLGRFDLLLIDEAHRIPLKGDGLYLQFLAECRRFNPDLRVVGLTATPYRLQGAAVPVCGPEYVLTDVAYEASIGDLIAGGYLSPLVSRAGRARADLTGVHTRGGEYVEAELARAVDKSELVEAACDELCALAADRRAWIVFAVTVQHAEHVADALKARGVATGIVHGGTPKAEREQIIADYQRGVLRALVNVNVLSEGFDAPHVDCVAMLRPTKSPGLYYQQVGRGMRLAPGKADCLVLDFAGNIIEHGPVDGIKVTKPRKAGQAGEVQTAPAKECPSCHAVMHAAVSECAECGHKFPAMREPNHSAVPLGGAILRAQAEAVRHWHPVDGVTYRSHTGKSGVPTLEVTYLCGFIRFREWVCLEHANMARAKAAAWWTRRAPQPTPRTIEAALERQSQIAIPRRILVSEEGRYPEIVDHDIDTESESRAGRGPAADAGATRGPADRHTVRGLLPFPGGLVRSA